MRAVQCVRLRPWQSRLWLFALVLSSQLVVVAVWLGTGIPPTGVVLVMLLTAAVVTLIWARRAPHPQATGNAPAQNGMSAGAAPVATDAAGHLEQELARLHAIYQHSHDAILLFDPVSGRLNDANPRAEAMLGMRRQQLCDLGIADIHDEDPDDLRSLIDEVMDNPHGCALRLNYRAQDGHSIPAHVSLSRITWDGGELLLCVARDASDHERAHQQIAHLAYHDTLTGLPNRALLTDRINRALARTRRTALGGALLFLDLDKFKRINDSLGHAVGDQLLQALALRLQQTLREEDTIARLGGDEFVILLEGLGQPDEVAVDKAREISEKLRQAFIAPFSLHGHELYVTASIGIVTFPQDGDSVDTLLRHADTAMYHAKGAGRDAAKLFEHHMDEAAMSRLQFEQDLRQGLHEGQFTLYFQPIQTIREGRLLGAEALLRWQHPQQGLITPSAFLPYIENSALMLKLGDWILHQACETLGALQRDPLVDPPTFLGINIGRQQFEQTDFVQRVERILTATGAEPTRLQFEITETVLLHDDKDAIARMHELRHLGIRFALDDFGTGYSSLADLRRLPIETLKIDRKLIRDIATDPHDEAIVRAMLSMAGHIGLEVIAKGVETRAQLDVLRDAACTYYQGFLARPPIRPDTFREELAFHRRNAVGSDPAPITVSGGTPAG